MKKFFVIFIFCNLYLYGQQSEVDNYFNEIAYKNEFTNDVILKKWSKDIKIFICDFNQDIFFSESVKKDIDSLKLELSKIVFDLNVLIDPINISIVDSIGKANFFIYLGSSEWYNYNVPESKPYTISNYGLGWVSLEGQTIVKSEVYVNIYKSLTLNEKKHLLREEITQSLGLFNDSWLYPNSIFYQGWTDVVEFSELDKKIITKLYN